MLDANFDVTTLQAEDLQWLSPGTLAGLATQMLARMTVMGAQLEVRNQQAAAHAQEIKFKDTKIERITFKLALLKAWKFGARTERMNAEQRQLFEETVAEDEASLQAQLRVLQGASAPNAPPVADTMRRPRRRPLPEHLRRVVHRHEPENTPLRAAAKPWRTSVKM